MPYLTDAFPLCPGYGYRRAPRYRTESAVAYSGKREPNRPWESPLWDFHLPLKNRTEEEIDELLTLFHAAAGSYATFPFQDRYGYKSCGRNETPAATDQALGTAEVGQDEFQLYLNYTSGGATTRDKITRPESSELLVAIDGTPTTAFTLGALGLITLNTPASGGEVLTWGGTFHRPVYFADDEAIQTIHEYSAGFISDADVVLRQDRE